MENKIQNLYQNLLKISLDYLIYQKRNNVESVKKIIPQIQEFVLWFLERNRFGMEEELYQNVSQNLLWILEDILESLKQQDRVLLQDALAYGLMEYLEPFIKQE